MIVVCPVVCFLDLTCSGCGAASAIGLAHHPSSGNFQVVIFLNVIPDYCSRLLSLFVVLGFVLCSCLILSVGSKTSFFLLLPPDAQTSLHSQVVTLYLIKINIL